MSTSRQFTGVLRDWAEVFMRRSMHEFAQFMRSHGLSMPQVTTMLHLYYRGHCGVSDIADHLDVTRAAASQMVDRLVQLGWLERSEHPQDRRIKRVDLTPEGRSLVQESIKIRQEWMHDLTAILSPGEQETITTALTCLTRAAYQLEPQEPAPESAVQTA